MSIDKYQAFFIGAALGWLVTYRWTLMRENRAIPELRRLIAEITSRIEILGSFTDLTPAQQRLTMDLHRLVTLEELLDFYQWAEKVKTSNKKTDVIGLTALAIICEKLLGLTRVDAAQAMRQAKRATEYKTLLPNLSKNSD